MASRRETILAMFGAIVAACTPRASSAAPPRTDLYACDGCEAVFERKVGDLSPVARIAAPDEPGERLIVTGRVTLPDGKTPAADVVLYAHQTNAEGLYAGGNPDGSGSERHGRLKGWVKTDAEGRYRFETIKPAPYPTMTMPAHIHIYVAEPGREAYYIDDVVFDGEFGVDASYRANQELRGGSGIVSLLRDEKGVLLARRDIILERHP